MNYCINTAWHGASQPVMLLRGNGSRGCSDSSLELNCIVGSGVSHLPLERNPYPLWGSGQSSWLANQVTVSKAMARKPVTSSFGTVGRCNILLEKEFNISAKLVSRQKYKVHFLTFLGRCLCWVWTAAQIITDWKLYTGLQPLEILCFFTLPPDAGTLTSK